MRSRAPQDWFGRAVSLLSSNDCRSWKDEGIVVEASTADPPAMDIYSFSGFKCGASWVGLLQAYYQEPERHVLDVQLAESSDGRKWRRLNERKSILPLGIEGEWDRFNHNVINCPVEVGDETRIYYSGRCYRHGGYAGYTGSDKGIRFGAIGLASWRRDGFASLSASFSGGNILTHPIRMQGSRLFVNAKADYGELKVDILNPDRSPALSFMPVKENGTAIELRPESGVNEPLTDKSLRLSINLKNARLYSVWCE